MTFAGPTGTTYGGYLAHIRDAVASLTGWTLALDNTNGNDPVSSTPSVYWVWENPHGEYVEIKNTGTIKHETYIGPDYDTGTESWNDRYQCKWSASNGDEFDPVDDSGLSTQVEYMTYYTDSDGWISYCRDTSGNRNSDGAWGMAELTDLWDYQSGANREGHMAYIQLGTDSGSNYKTLMPESTDLTISDIGSGMTNPDANFSNYPLVTPTWVRSAQFENGAGNSAVIASHDLLITDRSGGGSAFKDTIQDEGGNDYYKIIKNQGSVPDIGMRMG